MGIRIIIAVSLVFVLTNAQAATNSWKFAGSDFWDAQSRWSLTNYPTLTDAADFITNTTSKTVTIDENDTLFVPDSLTISNLTVGATGSTTNTLFLSNMTDGGAVPLHILNGLTVTNGGILQVTNSMLQVDGLSGGTFNLSGAMRLFNGADVQVQDAIIATNAVLQFALGTNSSPVVVNNSLTLGGKVNIIDGGGLAANTYTVFTYGGALTYNGLTVGSSPANFTFSVDTNTLGQIDLIVSVVASSPFAITSIVRQTNDILITWSTTGNGTTNRVEVSSGAVNGSYTNNFTNLSSDKFITTATTNYLDVGGATNTPSRFYRVRLVP